ncbi:hypothetical protein ASPVEDRAFT_89228 [Aspergillus versicolor CBS 583.65]|uniref:Uncharacterized protein n=1 Tax=Aspergillus versicolor CBS 583.65 TaxID=1036611 RepID=A0A1L9Q2K6_ASPVE|nr:uncharacterized protein ASPVEDRAFT_89228 [Aspergillus versicolor CBS 583.65]OJJ07994.1 hypothetical protein ASPVEDRAFT_89228 [Aspergillus versicolor CBS 583.65]
MAGEEDPSKKQPASSPESSRQRPDDDNPFVAFRRFADEQISSMLQSVMGIPSSSTAPRSDQWSVFTEDQNYRDARRQNYNTNDANNRDGTLGSGNQGSPSTQNGTNSNNISPSSPSRSERSSLGNSFDMDMFFNSFFDRFLLDFFQPSHQTFFSPLVSSDSAYWPVNYLMFSPYSPLHLERQARYRSHREQGVLSSLISSMGPSPDPDPEEPRWREAFEDLLRLENGMPMLDREPGPVAKQESGKEWIHNLVKRGSLGSQWKFVSGSDKHPWSSITLERSEDTKEEGRPLKGTERTDWAAEDTNAKQLTELDLYDRFLADIDAREKEFFGDFHHSPLLRLLIDDRLGAINGVLSAERESSDDTESWLELVSGGNKHSTPESTEVAHPPTTAEEKSPAENFVLSTQVSTDRVRLPDGSIQTKTVKTKRFADGREETNESTEVVNPPQHDQGSSSGEKKNGWFWKD